MKMVRVAMRVKKLLMKKGLNKKYSFKQGKPPTKHV